MCGPSLSMNNFAAEDGQLRVRAAAPAPGPRPQGVHPRRVLQGQSEETDSQDVRNKISTLSNFLKFTVSRI